MHFDPENEVIKLCAAGMHLEAGQKSEEAKAMFLQAWDKVSNDFEKFTAAHYVARHQHSIAEKLNWDKTALKFALKLNDNNDVLASYSSLYLNIAKCYEDLNDFDNAQKNYQDALFHINYLPGNGYGKMIISGIKSGLERTS